ncbi:MAG: hypothetical protein Ct9H300mP13_1060 [Gammaproteobacteria bacterium]|nr:MAG: hypothetical protein Ct9H300mP13_1060 [Gammaproteobacteria bacterium]
MGKPFANGKTFDDCNLAAGNVYPVYNAATDDLRTLVSDINVCLKANGEKTIKNVKVGKMARLVAHYRAQFNGQPRALLITLMLVHKSGMRKVVSFIGPNGVS